MTTMTGMEQITTLFQKEGARKVMNHLQFQPEFIEKLSARSVETLRQRAGAGRDMPRCYRPSAPSSLLKPQNS